VSSIFDLAEIPAVRRHHLCDLFKVTAFWYSLDDSDLILYTLTKVWNKLASGKLPFYAACILCMAFGSDVEQEFSKRISCLLLRQRKQVHHFIESHEKDPSLTSLPEYALVYLIYFIACFEFDDSTNGVSKYGHWIVQFVKTLVHGESQPNFSLMLSILATIESCQIPSNPTASSIAHGLVQFTRSALKKMYKGKKWSGNEYLSVKLPVGLFQIQQVTKHRRPRADEAESESWSASIGESHFPSTPPSRSYEARRTESTPEFSPIPRKPLGSEPGSQASINEVVQENVNPTGSGCIPSSEQEVSVMSFFVLILSHRQDRVLTSDLLNLMLTRVTRDSSSASCEDVIVLNEICILLSFLCLDSFQRST